jgi:hypothetical protein
MARFYKTAKPEFIEDIIYQPPWELIQQAGEYKQTQYDNALAQTEMLNGLLKINYIDEEGENEKVQQERQYWESQIDDITNQIRTTGDYRKLMPKVREVQKGIMNSMTEGNISKFTQSANIRDKHLAAIAEAKKNGGDIAAAQAAYNTYMDKWKNQENRSIDNALGYEEVISTPEELQGKNIAEMAKKVPAYQNSTFTVDPRGGWIVTTNGQEEYVSKEQLLETIQPYIMSNPNLRPYLDQRQRFGMGQYFNEDGSMIAPYQVKYYDANGNSYSLEEAQALPKEQQENLSKDVEFADNSLGQAFKLGTSFEYKKDKSTSRLQVDQVRENALNRAQRASLQEDRQAHDFEKMEAAHKKKLELLALDPSEDGDLARAELNRLSGFNSFAEIKNKSVTNMLDIVGEGGVITEAGKSKLTDIFNTLTKNMTGEELKAYRSLEQQLKSGKNFNTKQANAYIFNYLYPTFEDYLSKETGLSKDEILKKITELSSNPETKGYSPFVNQKSNYESLSKGEDNITALINNRTNNPVLKNFKNFSDRAKQYLDDNYNAAAVVKEFEVLPPANNKAITEIVNQNPGDYTFINVDTNEVVPAPGRMKNNLGVTGASGRAISQTMFEGEDGIKYVAIPLNSMAPSELAIRNIAIKGLEDTSRTKAELQDYRRGSVMQQFQEAGKSNNYEQEIVIEDKFFNTNSKLKQIGNGVNAEYQVIDKQFGTVQTFQDEDTFFNYLEEKAKLKK